MHPILKEIVAELAGAGDDPGLRYRFVVNAAASAAYSSHYG